MATITKEQFIIEMTLVDPVTKILSKLVKDEFRDCDCKWLDSRLEHFVKIACELQGIKGIIQADTTTVLNDFTKFQYIKRFTTLLDYFRTLEA